MDKHNKKFTLEDFISDVDLEIRSLKVNVWAINQLINTAKKHAPTKELEIRRELRPIAVELLYTVIGTPKTFEEVLSEMENQEDDHDN